MAMEETEELGFRGDCGCEIGVEVGGVAVVVFIALFVGVNRREVVSTKAGVGSSKDGRFWGDFGCWGGNGDASGVCEADREDNFGKFKSI